MAGIIVGGWDEKDGGQVRYSPLISGLELPLVIISQLLTLTMVGQFGRCQTFNWNYYRNCLVVMGYTFKKSGLTKLLVSKWQDICKI
jgi:hypothetical protein